MKTINKANFINMLAGKAIVEGEEPAEKRSRLENNEAVEEEEEEEREEKQSSWNILRFQSAFHALCRSLTNSILLN